MMCGRDDAGVVLGSDRGLEGRRLEESASDPLCYLYSAGVQPNLTLTGQFPLLRFLGSSGLHLGNLRYLTHYIILIFRVYIPQCYPILNFRGYIPPCYVFLPQPIRRHA